MEIVKDRSGNTLRVSQFRVHKREVVNSKVELQHVGALVTTEVAYMTFVEAVKEAIWLKRLLIESGAKLRMVTGVATNALMKADFSPRFQHRSKLLSIIVLKVEIVIVSMNISL
ncbi:hypothetical protein Tco_1363126 [Tanacetum coccineum]